MHGLLERLPGASRRRGSHSGAKANFSCEALEDRKLLSSGFGFPGDLMGGMGRGGARSAEMASFGAGRQGGFFGGGALGLGGGMRNPTLQTASSASTTSTSTSTSASTSSSSSTAGPSSAVQTAVSTLQTDLKNDTPSGGQPTHESVGAVQDDLDAIRKGTLTGSAAVTQVQTDTAAVLSSMGLTSAQITQIQTDQAALAAAIQASLNTATTTTSSTTASTLQSVSAYLVGLPGVGMRVAIGGIRTGGSFPGGMWEGPMFVTRGPGGFGMGSGPGFMMGR